MYEAVYLAGAREMLESLDLVERAEVEALVRLIEIDPWSVDLVTHAYSVGRRAAVVHNDDRWENFSRVVDDRLIEVYAFRYSY